MAKKKKESVNDILDRLNSKYGGGEQNTNKEKVQKRVESAKQKSSTQNVNDVINRLNNKYGGGEQTTSRTANRTAEVKKSYTEAQARRNNERASTTNSLNRLSEKYGRTDYTSTRRASKTAEERRKLTEARQAVKMGRATDDQKRLLESDEIGNVGNKTRNSDFLKTVEGSVEHKVGGLMTALGESDNDYKQYLEVINQNLVDGKISQKEADKLIENYQKTGKYQRMYEDYDPNKETALHKIGVKTSESGQKKIDEAMEDATGFKKVALQATQSGTEMLMDMATGPAWWATMATSVYGNTRGEAEKQGATSLEDKRYAALEALKETGTEYMFKGIGLARGLTRGKGLLSLGDKVVDKIGASGMSDTAKNVASGLARWGLGVGEENAEEVVGWGLDPLIANITYANAVDERNANSYRGAVQEQRESLRGIVNGLSDDEINTVASNLNSEEYVDALAQNYIENGADEETAYSLAGQMRDYLHASLLGDDETADEIENSMVETFTQEHTVKKSLSLDELGETLAATTLLTGVTGLPGAINQHYSTKQGEQIKNSENGQQTIDAMLDLVAGSGDESAVARSKAWSEQGAKNLSATQVADLANQAMSSVREDQVTERASDVVKRREIQNNSYVSPAMRDIDGNISLMPTTNRTYESTIKSAKKIAQRGEYQLPEGKTDVVSEAIASFKVGIMDTGAVNEFTVAHPEARRVFERVTGTQLPVVLNKDGSVNVAKTNIETKAFLFEQCSANYVQAAHYETANYVNQQKGAIDEHYVSSMGRQGQQVFSDIMNNIGLNDSSKYVMNANAVSYYYNAGRNTTMSIEELQQTLGEDNIYANVDFNARVQAFEAGRNDKLNIDGMAVTRGENMTLSEGSGRGVFSVDDGVQIDNSTRELFQGLAQLLNIDIRITDNLPDGNGNQVNGSYFNGEMVLNLNADTDRSINYIFMHEVTHHIKTFAPEEYQKLENLVRERWFDVNSERMSEAVTRTISMYRRAGQNLTEDEAMEEIIADATYEMINDEKFVSRACEDISLGKAILNAIRNALNKLRKLFAKAGGFEPRYNRALLSQLDILTEAERLWLDGLQAAIKNRNMEFSMTSAQLDRKYMEAVENDDMETAQRMVDDYAMKKGYETLVYHQTANEFTKFDIDNVLNSGGEKQLPYGVFAKSHNEDIGLPGKKQMRLYARTVNPLFVVNRADFVGKLPKEYQDIVGKYYSFLDKYDSMLEELEDKLIDAQSMYMERNPDIASEKESLPADQYLEWLDTIDDPEVVQAQKEYESLLDKIDKEEMSVAEKARSYVTEWLRSEGYDGLSIQNDESGDGRTTDALVLLSNTMVKSADPVTYDDNGKVVPLSQRFDSREEDIRWSVGGYDGYSMSNRAREAYDNGEKPLSKWTKGDMMNIIKEVRPDLVKSLKAIPVAALKNYLLIESSWHHTSSWYNETKFYEVNESRLENLTEEDISKWDTTAKKVESTRTRGDIHYIEWTGTRKHPKANRKVLENVEIEKRGSFYYVYDDNGNQILKKKIDSTGTSVVDYAAEERKKAQEQAKRDRSSKAALDYIDALGGKREKSHSGAIYAVGRKPSPADYDNGLENFFEKGEQRVVDHDWFVDSSYYELQTWNGEEWVSENNESTPRYSVIDTEYMSAVESGDMDKAQEIIDMVAKKSPYNTKSYHGTDDSFGFTEVDFSESDDGISFFSTSDIEVASTYSGTAGIRRIANTMSQTMSQEELQVEFDRQEKEFFDKLGEYVDILNKTAGEARVFSVDEVTDELNDTSSLYDFAVWDEVISENLFGLWVQATSEWSDDEAVSEEPTELLWEIVDAYIAMNRVLGKDSETGSGNYALYIDTSNYLEIDGHGANWAAIPIPQEMLDNGFGYKRSSTRYISKYAKDNGYDGVVFNNILDNSSYGFASTSTVYISFNKNAVKSADPVTYDDNGNIIPPSERFDTGKTDIRWSIADTHRDILERDMAEMYESPYTNNPKETGYLFPNGRMLRMGDYGSRGEDHSIVMQLYNDITSSLPLASAPRADAITRFVNEGNVRYMPETNHLEFGAKTEPTPELYALIRRIKEERGISIIEFTDENGKTVDARDCSLDSEDAIINGIKRFYKDGKIGGSQISQVLLENGSMVRFNIPTLRQSLPKASFVGGGFRRISHSATGVDITREAMLKNGFKSAEIEKTINLMNDIADYLENELSLTFTAIGWENLNPSSATLHITYKTDGDGNFLVDEYGEKIPAFVSLSAMVANGEYPVNFDFTTICNKREALNDLIKQLSVDKNAATGKALIDEIDLTDKNFWKINEALKKEGLDTACLGCFVEARRYNTDKFYKAINEKWNKAVRRTRKKLGLDEEAYFEFGDKDAEETQSIEDLWGKYEVTTAEKSSAAKRINALMDEIVKNKDVDSPYLKLVRLEDITTSKGIEGFNNLSTEKHNLAKWFKSIYGTSAPKEILGFTPYNSEIALLPDEKGDMTMEDYLKSIGGARMQSFSDFKIENVLDYMQMVADLKARKFPAHAYTKVLGFAKIFGMTGIKINLSVMFDTWNVAEWRTATGCTSDEAKEYAKEYAGLQFVKEKLEGYPNIPFRDGYLTYQVGDEEQQQRVFKERYDYYINKKKMSPEEAERMAMAEAPNVQSISYREAAELQKQDGYKENVGIIAVAYGKKHFEMLMEDPNVRYIIPYHKSGLPTFISKKTSLEFATNFTNFQNTTIAYKGVWKSNKKVAKPAELLEEYRKNHPDEKKPATQVLKMLVEEGYVPSKVPSDKQADKYKDENLKAYIKGLNEQKKDLHGTGTFDVYESLERAKNSGDKVTVVAEEYIADCLMNGRVPIFHEYANFDGYYKVLFDFSVSTDGENIFEQGDVTGEYPDNLKDLIREEAAIQNEKNIRKAERWENVRDTLYSNSKEGLLEGTNINVIRGDSVVDYTNPKLSPIEEEEPKTRYSVAEETEETEEPGTMGMLLDDDQFLDYIAKSYYSLDNVPCADPMSEEGRVRMARSKKEAMSSAQVKWNEKWRTQGLYLDAKSVKKNVRELVKALRYHSETPKQYRQTLVDETTDAVMKCFRLLKEGRGAEAGMHAFDMAVKLTNNLEFVDDQMFNDYKDMRDYFRNTKIYVPDNMKNDIDYTSFRKENMGRLLLGDDGQGVDAVYQEISELWPEFFNQEEDLADADMLLQMAAVLESIQPYRYVYESDEAAGIARMLAGDILDIAGEGKAYVSQADKYYEATQLLKQRHKEALRETRVAVRDLKKARAELEKTLGKLERAEEKVARRDAKIEQMNQKRRDEKAKKKEKAEHKKYFNHIRKNYDWFSSRLLTNTKDKNIPETFKRSLAHLLSALDLQTENSLKLEAKYGVSKTTAAMRSMREGFKDMMQAPKTLNLLELRKAYEKFAEDYNFEFNQRALDILDELADRLDGETVDMMTNDDLKLLDEALTGIKHMIQTYGEAFAVVKSTSIQDLGQQTIDACEKKIELRGERKAKNGVVNGIDGLINEDEETPVYFFEQIGGGINECYKAIRRGQDNHIRNIDWLRGQFKDILGAYAKKGKPGSTLEEWRDDTNAKTFTVRGGEITMSPAQIMSLHCLLKRDQAVQHIVAGGIRVTPIGINKNMLSKGKQILQSEAVTLNLDEAIEIANSLTDEQKNIANRLQEMLNGDVQEWGNKTSLTMFGIRLFQEENYFPIMTDENSRDTKLESDERANLSARIRNYGFTKAINPNATNPLIVDDIFSVVSKHCNEMSMYNSFAPALADFSKVYNYKYYNEDGKLVSVKQSIKKAYGDKADAYLRKFIEDINGNMDTWKSDGFDALINKSLANYKKAAIGLNLRVLAQQPTSIFRAFVEIDPKYFVGVRPSRSAMKEMFDRCPIALWKSWGNYDVNMGRSIDDIMMNNDWSKLDTVMMGTYGMADNMTWSMIWQAVKKEVAANNKDVEVGSDRFFELVNERASQVFDKTQVVDSPFHRSQGMRSKQSLNKIMMSFMAEPTLTYNVLRHGIVSSYEMWKSGDRKGSMKSMRKVVGVLLLNAAATSAAAALVDVLRGKQPGGDDDKEGTDLFLANFLANFVDNAGVWNNIYFVKDFDGRGTSNMALEGWEQLATAITMLPKVQEGSKTWGEFFKQFAVGFGYIAGLPTKTVIKAFDRVNEKFGVFASDGSDEVESDTSIIRHAGELFGLSGGGSGKSKDGRTFNQRFGQGNTLVYDKSGKASVDYVEAKYHDDDSAIDNFLDKFGINVSDAERADMEFEKQKKSIESKVKNLSGDERSAKVNEIVCEGMTKECKEGDVAAIRERKKLIIACGGDIDAFNEKVMRGSSGSLKTALKKTIGETDTEAVNKRDAILDYLRTNGMPESEISDVVYHSYTAKRFKAAARAGDTSAMETILSELIDAGLTEADYDKLWTYRNYGSVPTNYMTNDESESNMGKGDAVESMSEYVWPVTGTITSPYGTRSDPISGQTKMHYGLDIGGNPTGTPVGAAKGGIVEFGGTDSSGSNTVIINHGDGTKTYYYHLDGYAVLAGERVKQGQEIGKVGSTGYSTGPHLDFRIEKNGEMVDPMQYLPH